MQYSYDGEAGGVAHVRLVPMLDEGEAAATRRAAVNGVSKWSILDRCLEMGNERLQWQLDEILRPEVGGEMGTNGVCQGQEDRANRGTRGFQKNAQRSGTATRRRAKRRESSRLLVRRAYGGWETPDCWLS